MLPEYDDIRAPRWQNVVLYGYYFEGEQKRTMVKKDSFEITFGNSFHHILEVVNICILLIYLETKRNPN